MNDRIEPITLTANFDLDVSTVWSALTQLEKMQKWYFPMLESFDPKVGFTTSFTLEHEGRVFPHQWRITEVEVNKKIAYEWTFDGYAGRGVSTFILETVDEGTKLTLVDANLEPFPQDIPEFKRESAVSGWNYLINTSLKEYLENK